MGWHIIPLDPNPDQEFDVSVDVRGVIIPLRLHIRYNTEGDFWKMDVSNAISGDMLISGVPLLTGKYPAADILRQFQHIGIGSAIILQDSEAASSEIPDLFNLGSDFLLIWGDGDE